MKLIISVLVFFVNSTMLTAQTNYKLMMDDMSVNYYDVVKAADTYFETHTKGKGSGWKPYQRWKELNEYKYYPSGDRSNTDPYFAENAYLDFLQNNPSTKSFYNSGWRDLGPYSVDSITGHYSAGMGRVEHFYVDPNNSDLIYLGSRSGGFWRTTDAGINWQNTTDFLIASGVDAIAVSPTNTDSVLINVKNARNGTSHGIYRSSNGGINWTSSNFNPTNLGWGGLGSNAKIYKIAYHPTIPNLIFIGTSNGLYRSSDNLNTWTQLLSSSDIIDIDFHPTNDSIIYLYDDYYWGANQNVVLKSTDIGLSFNASNTIVGNNDARSYISISTDCPSCVYFASSNGIWKSTDEGDNFTLLSTNLNQTCRGFAVNDIDTSKMIYGYLDIEGSSDGGQSFNQITFWSQGSAANFNNGVYVHADLRDAQCINGTYYVATDGYLSKSTNNGSTWDILSQGTGIRENYSLGVSQSNHFRSISGSQDNGTSIKHETTWLEFYGADGMEGIIHPLNHDWMIGSLQYGGRRITKNGGATQGGATPPGQTGGWVAPLMYDPNDHMIVYSLGENINKSLNFGTSWDSIGTPSFNGTISEAAIAQNNSDIIVVSRGSSIEKSINGGITFTDISNNLPNYTITDIAFSPNNDNIIIVTFARYQADNEKIFISYNQGVTWINITNNLGNLPIRKVVIDYLETPNIYIGTEIGVYTKPLNSNTWVLYNTDLPNMAIEDLEIMWGTNTIRAATWGRGLWEYSLVGRSDFPAIIKTSITQTPNDNQPVQLVDQYVTSLLSYDHTITSAYVKYSFNNLSFSNTLTMSNTIDSTWVTINPISGGVINDKVYFKVYAIGSNNDTTETYKFMYTIKPDCISFGNMSWATAITNVTVNGINNSTGKTQPYTDYSSTLTSEFELGSTHNLSVNLNTDGNYSIYAKAWIDWNQNGNYLDAGEEYDLGFTQNSTNGITSNSPIAISTPNNALLGNTRMRVSARYGAAAQPCDTGFDGEVEDYEIVVTAPELSYTITNLISCLDEYILFDYTGNQLDSIYWSFSNGVTDYNGNSQFASVVFSDTGIYNFSLTGYIGGQIFTEDSIAIITIFPNDSTLINETICQGTNYILGSQIINTSGTYTENFPTQTCDSIVTLNLIVTSIDTSFIVQNYSLVATLANATYQWFDCDNQTIIPGETQATFTPIDNGNYALIVSDQNCIDTSACYEVNWLSINTFNKISISTYPNPVNDKVNIAFDQYLNDFDINIYSENGQLIKSINFDLANIVEIDMSSFSNGIYYLKVKSSEFEETVEIIKLK